MKPLIASIICIWLGFPLLAQNSFDIQGHRGCRGLMPENTIPAFLHAVKLGVTTLELDVVISQDHQVVVSHDPFMSAAICLDPSGREISKVDEKDHNLYRMTYEEIKQYNCGSKPHPGFPGQENQRACKPLLSMVVDTVERYTRENNLDPVWYNIETKCKPETDGLFHPQPTEFVAILIEVIQDLGIADRVSIQSFDIRTLHLVKELFPSISTVLLVQNIKSIDKNLEELGFNPDVYSPNYHLLKKRSIEELHARGIRVIPWTVNRTKDMERLIGWGVDGIITDYPNQLIRLKTKGIL